MARVGSAGGAARGRATSRAPTAAGLCGALRRCAAERGPKEVPRLGRVPVREAPSLAIGGSAHSRPITSRTGNTLLFGFGPGHHCRALPEGYRNRGAGRMSRPGNAAPRRANPKPAGRLWPRAGGRPRASITRPWGAGTGALPPPVGVSGGKTARRCAARIGRSGGASRRRYCGRPGVFATCSAK